ELLLDLGEGAVRRHRLAVADLHPHGVRLVVEALRHDELARFGERLGERAVAPAELAALLSGQPPQRRGRLGAAQHHDQVLHRHPPEIASTRMSKRPVRLRHPGASTTTRRTSCRPPTRPRSPRSSPTSSPPCTTATRSGCSRPTPPTSCSTPWRPRCGTSA